MGKASSDPKTKPNVFIIESLDMEDENKERLEGKYLFNYLKLLNKNPIYYYIRSRQELELLAPIFKKSKYRYLHISCHGNKEALYTTFDEILFKEFASIFKNTLHDKRVFISGCDLGNKAFAKSLFSKNEDIFSLVAPTEIVYFHQMLPFWSTFYYIMDSANEKSMSSVKIKEVLQTCSNIFNVDIAYFYNATEEEITVRHDTIKAMPITN